jgi:hypothetical protein
MSGPDTPVVQALAAQLRGVRLVLLHEYRDQRQVKRRGLRGGSTVVSVKQYLFHAPAFPTHPERSLLIKLSY